MPEATRKTTDDSTRTLLEFENQHHVHKPQASSRDLFHLAVITASVPALISLPIPGSMAATFNNSTDHSSGPKEQERTLTMRDVKRTTAPLTAPVVHHRSGKSTIITRSHHAKQRPPQPPWVLRLRRRLCTYPNDDAQRNGESLDSLLPGERQAWVGINTCELSGRRFGHSPASTRFYLRCGRHQANVVSELGRFGVEWELFRNPKSPLQV